MAKAKTPYKPSRRYDDSVKPAVIECIGNGLTDKDTAQKLGLSVGTIGLWKRSDPAFARDYGIAKLSLKEKYLKVVLFMAQSSNTDTVRLRAATWFLERKYPEEYAPHQVIHAPSERAPLDILLAQDIDEPEVVDEDSAETAGEMADEAREE